MIKLKKKIKVFIFFNLNICIHNLYIIRFQIKLNFQKKYFFFKNLTSLNYYGRFLKLNLIIYRIVHKL